jgi:hypothetical protein
MEGERRGKIDMCFFSERALLAFRVATFSFVGSLVGRILKVDIFNT